MGQEQKGGDMTTYGYACASTDGQTWRPAVAKGDDLLSTYQVALRAFRRADATLAERLEVCRIEAEMAKYAETLEHEPFLEFMKQKQLKLAEARRDAEAGQFNVSHSTISRL